MRTIHTDEITAAEKRLCMDANYYLNSDIESALSDFCRMEPERYSGKCTVGQNL